MTLDKEMKVIRQADESIAIREGVDGMWPIGCICNGGFCWCQNNNAE